MITLKRLDGTVIGEGGTVRAIAEANRTNLRSANLRGANLAGANLAGANLRGADLRGATGVFADLRYANLRGADLCGANLRGADLRGATCLLAQDRRGYPATLTWDKGNPSDVVIRFGCRRWTSLRDALAHYGPGYNSDGDRSECCTILRHLATLYRLRTGINLEERG